MVKVRKNRKKSWRKNVDISEVEEYLDDERLAERTGIKLTSAPQFIIEKTGSTKTVEELEEAPVKRKRTKEILKGLKVERSLNADNYSKVKALKPNRAGLNKIEKRRQKRKLETLQLPQQKPKSNDDVKEPKFYDLWEEPVDNREADIKQLEAEQIRLAGKNKPQRPQHLEEAPTILSAVEVPMAGASYNPSFADHQELMAKAHGVELKKLKDKMHLDRVVTKYFTRQSEAELNRTWMHEMSQGLGDADDNVQQPAPGSDNEEETIAPNPPVRADDRKTRAKRNREALLKKQQEEKEKAKKEKLFNQDLSYNVKALTKKIRKEETKSLERQKGRKERKEAKKLEPRRLGRIKYQDPDIELNLPSEINGSLRQIKPEGNLFMDRFKSLQKRSLIEARELSLKQPKRQKTREYTKRSMRDPVL